MERIYVLDAVNYLFRSYYAIGPMLNQKGQSTSALFGFIRSIQKLIRDFAPAHLIAVFDGPDNKKSRQAVYAEYKMNRKGAPEDLFPQFEWASKYCDLAGIPTLCVEGVEADDTMATVALWAEKQGAQVYLCTSDKDMMQLVNDQILMLHLHKNNLIVDASKVQELFGVRPDQMLDFLAIMGDASDNIPGLQGFGPKTAASLLQQFDTLDKILANPDKVKGEKKQHTLRTQQKEALMSRELATLHTSVDIPKDPSFYRLKDVEQSKLADFFNEMKFTTLLRDLGKVSEPKPPPESKAALQFDDTKVYHLIDTEEDLADLIKKLLDEDSICIDTETTDINPFLAHLVGIGFAVKPCVAWYVPLNGQIGKKRALEMLREFFLTTSASFYGHNLKYDYHILAGAGLPFRNIGFDTLLASYLLTPQNRRHNLDDLCIEKFQHMKIPLESLIGKGKKQISMRDVPIPAVKEYCCEDVDYTARLKYLFTEELKEKNLDKLLKNIDLPLLPILAEMENKGIFLDVNELRSVGERHVKELEKLKKQIYEHVGEEFNLNSPKQLSGILYEKLKLKARSTSTAAGVLEELIDQHPVIQLILKYRTLEKLRSTYIEALPYSINPVTDRIHCTFNQSVTATGRLSCQNPNLQNIPVSSEIRSCFKAKEGFLFLGADYSQIELRLLAHFSQDPSLCEAFRAGEDIHVLTASLIFGITESAVTQEMRKIAKTVNFGIIYGQSSFGLSKQLAIPYKDAAHFIKMYFERYPEVTAYLDECKAKVRKLGYSETLTGRTRPIPEIHNKNPSIRNAAERLAVNTPLQGTAADLIKMAMIQIDKEIRERKLSGKMNLQIHDELIFEIPEQEVEEFKEIVKRNMEQALKLRVPLEVDIAVGKNWAEC